jgi:hypothetical protein
MNNMTLPAPLLEQLKSVNRIFLSVNPVIAFSDVMMEIEKQVATPGNPVDVVPVDKLPVFTKSVINTAIITCGDMPLKELPSYLREIIHKDGLLDFEENISTSPWLALRVHISNANDHIFEFLSSSALELPKVSLCDSSWMKFNLLQNRFENSSTLLGNGGVASGGARKSSSTKVVGNDLEFLE